MKRIFTLIAAAVWCSTCMFAEKVKIGDLYYNLDGDNKTAEVTYDEDFPSSNYTGLTTVVIPDSVQYEDNYYVVIAIGESAFFECSSLQSVVISDSVKSIGNFAFFSCTSLQSIVIPNNVQTIGSAVFLNCSSLQSVTIGSGIQTITEEAFTGCQSLQSIVIPDNVQTIEYKAFMSCYNLESVTIGSGVQNIGGDAFYMCYSIKVIYNYAVTPQSIDADLFSDANTDECTLYVPAESLAAYQAADGWNAFGNIQAIPAASGTYKIGDLYYELDGNNLTAEVASDEDFPSSNYAGLTTVVIPDSVQYEGNYYVVTAIGEYAFYACSSLQSVVISDSVKTIGDVAFLHCTSLQSINVAAGNQKYCSVDGVLFTKDTLTLIQYPMGNPRTEYTIPANVQETNVNSFNGSQYLQSVTIPASVQTIGLGSFVECTNLQSVINYATTPQTADKYLFDGVDTNACTLYVPAASLSDYQVADVWKEFFSIQTIESIATGIEGVQSTENRVQKVIRDGKVLLLRGNKTYNTQGQQVR